MQRILVASCDAKFFPHARDLFASVQRTSADVVSQILFFDLGLTPEQRRELESAPANPPIRILDYPPALIAETYPDFLTPRMFAWKTYALHHAATHGDSILYLDCGCIILNSLRPIFESIERDHAFFIQDPHTNDSRTHEACFSIMRASPAERTATQIDAGVIGYSARDKFAPLFQQAFHFAKNRGCIFGDAAIHRHDQSIYSILAARHNVAPLHPYGNLVHWQGIQTPDQIIWQHRGKYPAFQRLQHRARQLPPGQRITLYGAGAHTKRFLKTFQSLLQPRHQITEILDDNPQTPSIEGLPINALEQHHSPDLIILSSDAHESALLQRARIAFPTTTVWPIYTTV